MLEVIFPFSSSLPANINWTRIEAIASWATGIVTMLGLILTWSISFRESKSQQSLFILKQIQTYFDNAVSQLKLNNNDSVSWHRAIQSIKIAESLTEQINHKSHKIIIVTNYLDTGFQLLELIKNIDDFRYFYGVQDYHLKSVSSLNQATQIDSHTRISPQELIYFCAFIDKANKIYYDSDCNKVPWEIIFDKDYFKQPSDKSSDFTLTTQKSLQPILEYIHQAL